jgi:glycosyltransferase involved in cell wall biosynthesis
MKVPRLDQFLAGFAEGDAISRQAIIFRNIFRGWGFPSDIFVDAAHVSPAMSADCQPLADYAGGAGDVAMHHFGTTSPAAAAFGCVAAHKILIYHNVTPAHFFRGYDDAVAAQLTAARIQVALLAPRCAAVWAVSRFDAEDLAALGVRNARVFPLLFTAGSNAESDPALKGRLTAPALTTLLFVGRLAPNKRVEDLIETYACYHRINPFSRLFVIGSERTCPRYALMLRMLARDLAVPNICFEGFVTPAGLETYYQLADVFVSCSAHEGYGAPLVEAMRHGVPVIARDAGGTSEALGGAGVMYAGATPLELARLIHRVTSDKILSAEILTAQQRRVLDIRARPVEQELRTLLAGFLPPV